MPEKEGVGQGLAAACCAQVGSAVPSPGLLSLPPWLDSQRKGSSNPPKLEMWPCTRT